MSTLEDIRQRYKAEFKHRKERLDKLESDINKAGERYGITTDNPMDSLASDCDSDGLRASQVGAEAVHERGSRNPNREFAEER